MDSVQSLCEPGKWLRWQLVCFYSLITVTIILMVTVYEQLLYSSSLTLSLGLDNNDSGVFSHVKFSNGSNDPTLILIWTTFFSGQWIKASHIFDECPADRYCITTYDRSRLKEASAIMFHIRDFRLTDIPKDRYPGQYYVFALWESPMHTGIDLRSPAIRHFFNLTLTYRLDSDGYSPYGIFRYSHSPGVDLEKVKAIAKGKSKLVAWFVSNCYTPSGREAIVDQLKKYLPVDIYGQCGPLKCEPRFTPGNPCNEMLTKDYKFYLSFENSLCTGYVTEKIYRTMNLSIVIPLVIERKLVMDTIKDNTIASVINKSIIAVDDFPNVKALADYLLYLDKNVTAYVEYLAWRESLESILYDTAMQQCQLCRVIKEGKERRIDVADWWLSGGQCHSWRSAGDQ